MFLNGYKIENFSFTNPAKKKIQFNAAHKKQYRFLQAILLYSYYVDEDKENFCHSTQILYDISEEGVHNNFSVDSDIHKCEPLP